MTKGFDRAFLVGAGLAVAGAILAAVLISSRDSHEHSNAARNGECRRPHPATLFPSSGAAIGSRSQTLKELSWASVSFCRPQVPRGRSPLPTHPETHLKTNHMKKDDPWF